MWPFHRICPNILIGPVVIWNVNLWQIDKVTIMIVLINEQLPSFTRCSSKLFSHFIIIRCIVLQSVVCVIFVLNNSFLSLSPHSFGALRLRVREIRTCLVRMGIGHHLWFCVFTDYKCACSSSVALLQNYEYVRINSIVASFHFCSS
jgi:hypothetical protein